MNPSSHRDQPTHAHRVGLGGATIEVRTVSAALSGDLEKRFRDFEADAAPQVTILHTECVGKPLVEWRDGERLVHLGAAATLQHIDAVLRTVLPRLVAPALVAHGAMLADGDRGYLCCGESGSGKSTIAGLFPSHALCDELALVRATPHGVEGTSLPYWKARPGTVTLAGVFILEHGLEHRRSRLGPAQAVRELHRHVSWPDADPAMPAGVFDTLAALASLVPVWRLAFRPEPSVWDVITAPA